MPMVQVECSNCHVQFERRQADVTRSKKEGRPLYCSRKCSSIVQATTQAAKVREDLLAKGMKFCNFCKKDKPLEQFSKKGRGFATNCKDCAKIHWNNFYAQPEKRKKHIASNKIHSIKRSKDIRVVVSQYLTDNPCIDCGEVDITCLEFDHRNTDEKDDAVAYMVGRGYALPTIFKEIKKCDVRCANCHRKRHAKENKNVAWKFMNGLEI